jgi:hypothetical protein
MHGPILNGSVSVNSLGLQEDVWVLVCDGRKVRLMTLIDEFTRECLEAAAVIGHWRSHYNTARPHSSLGYRPPAPLAFSPVLPPLDQVAAMQ